MLIKQFVVQPRPNAWRKSYGICYVNFFPFRSNPFISTEPLEERASKVFLSPSEGATAIDQSFPGLDIRRKSAENISGGLQAGDHLLTGGLIRTCIQVLTPHLVNYSYAQNLGEVSFQSRKTSLGTKTANAMKSSNSLKITANQAWKKGHLTKWLEEVRTSDIFLTSGSFVQPSQFLLHLPILLSARQLLEHAKFLWKSFPYHVSIFAQYHLRRRCRFDQRDRERHACKELEKLGRL